MPDQSAKVYRIIEGLEIFKKYGEVETAAEHAIFYASPAGDTHLVWIEDQKRLDLLGWSYEEEYDSWATFT